MVILKEKFNNGDAVGDNTVFSVDYQKYRENNV